jgi:hypothetical protein
MRKASIALALLTACAAPCAAQGRLGVNVYGLSYHVEREEAHESGVDNEFNPGLGLRWRTPGERFDWFLDGGVYRDSGRNTAVYAGIGTFWKPTERLRLGAALVGFHSDTYNEGDAFIAPLPI